MIKLWRVFERPVHLKDSFCNSSFKRNAANLSSPHVYKKTWSEKELLRYLRNNVVYESDKYYVTSLPPGIVRRKRDLGMCDSESSITTDVTLNSLKKQLMLDFETKFCKILKYPSRNASGLTFFTKDETSWNQASQTIVRANVEGTLIFCFLALVMGRPNQIFIQKFGIKPVKEENGLSVEIKDISVACKKCKIINYQHKVLCSTEEFSLVKVEVSNDEYDNVRHFLAHKSFTPVFGDFWNIRRKQGFMFGVPLVRDTRVCSTASNVLDLKILEKLELEPDEENCIPPHIHFYSITLPLKRGLDVFVSVPPPDYFIWTCNQLGLHEIEKFTLP